MKKLLSVILTILITLCFSACKKKQNNTSDVSSSNTVNSTDSVIINTPTQDTSTSKSEITNSEKQDNFEGNEQKENSVTVSSTDELSSTEETIRPEKVTKIYSFVNKSKTIEFQKDIYQDPFNGNTIPYCLYVPEDYTPSEKYPVILNLHGAGEIGTDNSKQLANTKKMFEYNYDLVKNALILCPQSYEWWNLDKEQEGDQKGTLGSALHLLEKIKELYSCDSNRIYVMGLSMGGYATWDLLEKYGDIFAAGIPICGGGNPSNGSAFKDVPIRIFHGTDDPTVPFSASQSMYNSIINAGGQKVEFIKLAGVKHNAWEYAFSDRDTFSWLFAQNKVTNPNCEYEYIPRFKIIDSARNTVISDKDVLTVYQTSDFGATIQQTIKIELSAEGQEKLRAAYTASKNNPFTVYCSSQKVYSFTATEAPKDNYFYISGIFETIDVYDFYGIIKKIEN